MSSKFYASFVAAGYQAPQERPPVLLGFELLRDFNGVENVSYMSGDVIIHVSRGTARKKDLIADAAILTGTENISKRMSMERKRLAILLARFPKHKVYLVGHSLAGRIVLNLIKENVNRIEKAIAFNPGSSVSHLARGVKNSALCKVNKKAGVCKARRKSLIFGRDKDIISILGILDAPSKNVEIKKGFHSLDQYL